MTCFGSWSSFFCLVLVCRIFVSFSMLLNFLLSKCVFIQIFFDLFHVFFTVYFSFCEFFFSNFDLRRPFSDFCIGRADLRFWVFLTIYLAFGHLTLTSYFVFKSQSLIGSRQRGQICRVARRLWTVKIGRFSICIWSSPFLLRVLNFIKLKQKT